MTTELTVEGGMHIEPDAKTGAIAASVVNEDIQKVQDAAAAKADDQPEQTASKEGEEEQKVAVNPRDAIMKSIYEGRAKQFKDELEYAAQISGGATMAPATDDPEQQPATKEEGVETPTEKKVAKQADQPAAQQQEQPKKKMYIINGQNVELTDEELAQLATNSLNQQQAYMQQQALLRQQQQPPQQVGAPQPQPVQQQQGDPDLARLKDIARRMTYGSEDESVKALQEFGEYTARSVQKTQGPTPEQIVQVATTNAMAQIQFQTNLETIAKEFPDVFGKRSASLVAADYVNNLRNKYYMLGTPKPDIELYREACQMTRSEFKPADQTTQPPTQRQTAVQVTPNQTKVERKRSAPQPPAPVARVIAAETNKAATGSDIVNAMRKARGQSAMN